MPIQRLRIGEDTDGLYRTIDAKEWSECPYLGIRSPFSQSHPSRGAWIGMTLIAAVTPLHPHITQGRPIVESPTWRGVRHGIVPRWLSGLQWPLIQVGSRAMGLQELRMKRGLTQRELAQRSGVHHVEIAQIETGKRNVRAVSLDTALRLCDALRVRNPRKLLDPDSDSSAD